MSGKVQLKYTVWCTWWGNGEVQECIQRNRLAKNKLSSQRVEEWRQKACSDFYVILGTNEGEKDFY